METFHKIEEIFDLIVNYLVLAAETIGIIILVYAVVIAIISICRNQPHARLRLSEGIALALEFEMCGEILKSIIVKDWTELGILAAIIALRILITFVILFEVRLEHKQGIISDEQLHDIKTPLTQSDYNAPQMPNKNKAEHNDDENKSDKNLV